MSLKKLSLLAVLVMVAGVLAACGGGAEYPSGPITMMVPFRAGGGTDTQARVLAVEMEEVLGQPINVINNTGAGGTVGVQELLASEADGQTIAFVVSVAVAVNPQLQELPFGVEDVKVVGISSIFQSALVTSGDAPYNTWDEFLTYAKENPGLKYMFLGADNRIVMEAIAEIEGLEIEYVPADGGAALAPAIIAGDVDFGFSGGIHSRFLETGEMKVLLNMNASGPLMATPDVPSGQDLYGISDEVQGGLIVPADTSDEVVDALSAAFKTAVESEAYADVMANLQFPANYVPYPEAQGVWQGFEDAFAATLE